MYKNTVVLWPNYILLIAPYKMLRVEHGNKELLFVLQKLVTYQIFFFVSLINTAVVATVGFKQDQESLNLLTSVYF